MALQHNTGQSYHDKKKLFIGRDKKPLVDTMEEHRADKRKGEVNEIPDGHDAVSSELVGGVEILKTKEKDKWPCEHEDCDEVFESKEALAGHQSAHKGE